jgi:predicted Zn-dependent protease
MIRKIKMSFYVLTISLMLAAFNDYSYSQENITKGIPDKTIFEEVSEAGENLIKGKPEIIEYEKGRKEFVKKFNDRKASRETRNYFRIDRSGNTLWNGKHWQPEKFPLKVYVKKSESENFKEIYKEFIDYSFKVWKKADNRIEYSFVNSSEKADIIISFEDNLMDKYEENYLGLTDYELGENRSILRSTIEIGLIKFKNERLSDGEIKATIIHEIGHALGLGHSTNSADLMYPYIDPDSDVEMHYDELSKGDKEAIRSVINLCYDMEYSLN